MNTHLSETSVSEAQVKPVLRGDTLPRIGVRFASGVGGSIIAAGVIGAATRPELGATVGVAGLAVATLRAGIDCARRARH